MKTIIVTVDSNDYEISMAVAILLKRNPFGCNYNLEINAVYPLQYHKPFNAPYFADAPVYCMNFYYHFAEDVSQNQQAHFQELEIFAQAYSNHIKQIMVNSGLFTERLAETQNPLLMQRARMGSSLEMDALRKKLASTACGPQLFSSHTAPQNMPSNEENNSNIPYYLCGLGLIVALSAIAAPVGLAIALAYLGAFLFIVGEIVFLENRLAHVEDESAVDLSPTGP